MLESFEKSEDVPSAHERTGMPVLKLRATQRAELQQAIAQVTPHIGSPILSVNGRPPVFTQNGGVLLPTHVPDNTDLATNS